MKTLPQEIFNEFKEKLTDPSYHPTTPLEALKARLTATWGLQHEDPNMVRQAHILLQKTSMVISDLSPLHTFSKTISTWDLLEICSTSTNPSGICLEYKLSVTTKENVKKTLHVHAQYAMKGSQCYFLSETTPAIRIIGDPILHQPGIPFPNNPTPEEQQALMQQIAHAKSVLIQTGGAGIAANQCKKIENPYCFAIVGVFYESAEHVQGVRKRYPTARFPQAKVLLNPVVTHISQTSQTFHHGCLSVPCANRCTVVSPEEIKVSYQDPMTNLQTQETTFTGVDAVVLWHELTHILLGKTYMDVTFESLSIEDLKQLQKMISDELKNREVEKHHPLPELTVPPFHLSVHVNDRGYLTLQSEEWANVLPKITNETLQGLLHQAELVFDQKNTTGFFQNPSKQCTDSDENMKNVSGFGLSKL